MRGGLVSARNHGLFGAARRQACRSVGTLGGTGDIGARPHDSGADSPRGQTGCCGMAGGSPARRGRGPYSRRGPAVSERQGRNPTPRRGAGSSGLPRRNSVLRVSRPAEPGGPPAVRLGGECGAPPPGARSRLGPRPRRCFWCAWVPLVGGFGVRGKGPGPGLPAACTIPTPGARGGASGRMRRQGAGSCPRGVSPLGITACSVRLGDRRAAPLARWGARETSAPGLTIPARIRPPGAPGSRWGCSTPGLPAPARAPTPGGGIGRVPGRPHDSCADPHPGARGWRRQAWRPVSPFARGAGTVPWAARGERGASRVADFPYRPGVRGG